MPVENIYDPRSVRALLAQDRDLTFAGLQIIALSLPPDEVQHWEWAFLNGAAAVEEPELRIRAMEVYAALKVAQATHCEPVPGYVGYDGPIPRT